MGHAFQLRPDVFCLPLGNLLANCYIIRFQDKAILIDPGDESSRVLEVLQEMKLSPEVILTTHVHFDHVGANYQLQQQFALPIYMHQADEFLIEGSVAWAQNISDLYKGFTPARFLTDGEELLFGDKKLKVLHTPGHSPGSICFLMDDILFAGDLIFANGGYGRTDLWGGSYNTIMNSIAQKVLTLPEDTMICPGHGPVSYVRDEAVHYDPCA